MINDAALSDMASLSDKLSFLKVLFLCSISVSAGPLSSVILSPHSIKFRLVSVVLVVRASEMYCSPSSPIGLAHRFSFLSVLVVLNASAMYYEAPTPVILLLPISISR